MYYGEFENSQYYAPDETKNIKFVPSIKSPKISPRETQKLGGQCKLSRGQGRNQGLLIASPSL